MPSMRQWVWSDELVTLLEEGGGVGTAGAPPPLIGFAIEEGTDIGAFAERVVGREHDEPADPDGGMMHR